MKYVALIASALLASSSSASDHNFRMGNVVYYEGDHWVITLPDDQLVHQRFVGDDLEFPMILATEITAVNGRKVIRMGTVAECVGPTNFIVRTGQPFSVRGQVDRVEQRSRTALARYRGSRGTVQTERYAYEPYNYATLVMTNCQYGQARDVSPVSGREEEPTSRCASYRDYECLQNEASQRMRENYAARDKQDRDRRRDEAAGGTAGKILGCLLGRC